MLLLRYLCLIALSLSICGCGGESGPLLVAVTGAVTIDGKPLAGATVTMRSEKGDLSNGFTDSEGKFKMTTGGRSGMPVGPAKVGITKYEQSVPIETVAGDLKAEDMQKMQMAAKGKTKDAASKSEIPERYGNPEKSGLVANVDSNASKNVFEYPLVSK